MKILGPLKRVVDYNVNIYVKADGSDVELAKIAPSKPGIKTRDGTDCLGCARFINADHYSLTDCIYPAGFHARGRFVDHASLSRSNHNPCAIARA